MIHIVGLFVHISILSTGLHSEIFWAWASNKGAGSFAWMPHTNTTGSLIVWVDTVNQLLVLLYHQPKLCWTPSMWIDRNWLRSWMRKSVINKGRWVHMGSRSTLWIPAFPKLQWHLGGTPNCQEDLPVNSEGRDVVQHEQGWTTAVRLFPLKMLVSCCF